MGYKFERFVGGRQNRPRPKRMEIGQVVVRKNMDAQKIRQLKTAMRKAMREHGFEFSVAQEGRTYVIRRDR